MAWKTEYAPAAIRDLQSIFRHLVIVQHETFGYDLSAADQMATSRIMQVRETARRIHTAPMRDTAIDISGVSLRYLTLDRTVFWFRPNLPDETVTIEGVFLKGQDHFSRMTARIRTAGSGEAG